MSRMCGFALATIEAWSPADLSASTTRYRSGRTATTASSKAFGEALGRLYSEHFGLQVACLRIGSFTEENDPTANIRMRATWCSHRDLAQLIRLCLKAPDLEFRHLLRCVRQHLAILGHIARREGVGVQARGQRGGPLPGL